MGVNWASQKLFVTSLSCAIHVTKISKSRSERAMELKPIVPMQMKACHYDSLPG